MATGCLLCMRSRASQLHCSPACACVAGATWTTCLRSCNSSSSRWGLALHWAHRAQRPFAGAQLRQVARALPRPKPSLVSCPRAPRAPRHPPLLVLPLLWLRVLAAASRLLSTGHLARGRRYRHPLQLLHLALALVGHAGCLAAQAWTPCRHPWAKAATSPSASLQPTWPCLMHLPQLQQAPSLHCSNPAAHLRLPRHLNQGL